MKNSSFLLLFLLVPICLFSQTGRVDYILIEKKTGSKTIDSKKATLFFSTDSSLFIHSKASAFGEEDAYWPSNVDWFKDKNKDDIGAYIVDPVGQGVYKNFISKRLQFRKMFLAESYTLDEPKWIDLKWKIFKDKKIIGNIQCQKAMTKFRGRSFTAWFAPSIPIHDGPWKLNGCPGLILEAYDDTDEVVFLFSGIKYPLEETKSAIGSFPVTNVHTFEEFKNAPEIEFQKMKRRSLSSESSSGTIKRIVNKELELEF
jgi:GLPGLI family protein